MLHQSKTAFLEQDFHLPPIIANIFSSGLFIPLLVGNVVLLH